MQDREQSEKQQEVCALVYKFFFLKDIPALPTNRVHKKNQNAYQKSEN